MINRKKIIYILLTVLGIILAYNYFIAPLIIQNSGEMGFGMHSRMYINTGYFIDARIILAIAIILSVVLLLELLLPKNQSKKCSKCGKDIESEIWKVCPICGNTLKNRKG
jgi:hypothetical protein